MNKYIKNHLCHTYFNDKKASGPGFKHADIDTNDQYDPRITCLPLAEIGMLGV